jgi:hypothetical protein
MNYSGDYISDSDGGKLKPISSVMRNRIINGAMVIDQRNAGASVTNIAGGVWSVDRWRAYGSQASKFTVQQNAGSVTPPVGFSNYMGFTSSSAYSVGSGDFFFAYQTVEGFNWADLNWGTANAKTVTLSFWAYSSLTGTFGGSLRNYAQTYSYPFTYTISSANTWTQVSITIAGPTSGTWTGATNDGAVQLSFNLGTGSTYSGTAGSWSANNYISATGATSVVGTNGATFYITGVQLEVGSSATGFEYRQYGQELALCQRYYEVLGSTANPYCQDRFYNNANRIPSTVQYAATKRATPSITVYSGNNTVNNMSGYSSGTDNPVTSIASPGITFIGYFINMTNAITQPHLGYFTASAEL